MNTQPIQGIVTFKSNGNCSVLYEGREIACTLAPHLYQHAPGAYKKSKRKSGSVDTDPLAVGDEVLFSLTAAHEGQVQRVLPRRSQLSRRAASPKPGGFALEQIIAANVDQVIAVMAVAQPEPKWNLLDRYLVMAEAVELPVVVCLTKCDLLAEADPHNLDDLQDAIETYTGIGYPVVQTSSSTLDGLDQLRNRLSGHRSIFLGKSGVGKTSLLNALIPDLAMRVSAVSQVTGKGRHTTSAARLLSIADDSDIIDTPGTREFGLWDVDPDVLDDCFPEMRPYIGRCKFRLDCRHEEEPGCAVRRAVMSGEIHPRRYQSFIRLKEDYLQ